MYLGIDSEDLRIYNLPKSDEQLYLRIKEEFQLQGDMRYLKSSYRKKMQKSCKQQAYRIKLSNLYYLHGCVANKSNAQLMVLIVINNDFKRLDKILSQTTLANAKQIVNKKYHNFALIYFSARAGLRKPMRILIKHEKDISSPIHAASFYGQIDILKLLIDLGAPTDLNNKFGNTPRKETQDQTVIKLLQNAYNNKIDELNFRLTNQGKSNGKIRIYYKGELVGQKIILNNYEYKSFNRIRTFHGTKFQVLESIVKNGMKMPGDIVQGRRLQIVKYHIKEHIQVFGMQNFAQGIFSSPSILYAGCPVYAKTFQVDIEGEKQQWDPILQLRVRKEFFDQFTSTVSKDYKAMGQPEKIEVRVGFDQRQQFYKRVEKGVIKTLSNEPAEVQAVIFVKSGFLMKDIKKKGIVQQMNKLFLESEEQQFFLLRKQK